MIPTNWSGRDVVAGDLDRLAASYPSMVDLVGLYRAIGRRQAEIADAFVRAPVPDAPDTQAKLFAGEPALQFEQLALDARQLAEWVSGMSELMALGGIQVDADPDDAEEMLSPAELLDAVRDGFERRAGPTDGPFAGSLTRLALGQVFAAILRGAAKTWLAALDLSDWQRGNCPVCGGWPDLGTLNASNNTQTMACGRCDAMWPYRRVGCPFCATDDAIKYYASSDEKVRLSVCGTCHTYLKQVRLPLAVQVQSLLGLRLLTVGQDLDAQEAGWSRPST